MDRLELFLLGPPRVVVRGQAVTITERKALALLIVAALSGEGCRRDSLATLLWPEHEQARARANLRYTLWVLKRTLGAGWFAIDRESVSLRAGADVWVDVVDFQAHVVQDAAGDERTALLHLEKGVALYRDDFLAGFTLTDSAEFDAWQFLWSEQLRGQLATALEKLVRHYASHHDSHQKPEIALDYARRWLALDSLHEPVHRHLMQLYAQSGQRAMALRQYEECVRLLEQELGVGPEAESTALYEEIRTKRYPASDGQNNGLALVTSRSHASPLAQADLPQDGVAQNGVRQEGVPKPSFKLPIAPTPFIGREHELRQLSERLSLSTCRLLTILGPGGMGKSRLAVEAARALGSNFADGVCFVPLTTIESEHGIAGAIMQALNVALLGTDAPELQVVKHLGNRNMLLILDNYEQLLPDVSLVSSILDHASGVTLLVTGRERLNLQEEWLLPLDGLSYPSAQWVKAYQAENAASTAGQQLAAGGPTLADLEQFGAIRFFVQCVQRLQPDFALDATNAEEIIELCRCLGGMPLGIELAAGWTRALALSSIAAEIERNLEILATSVRNQPERHRSLQAVFDHSWRLLSAQQRAVLRQLSVFRGGLQLNAAIAVASADLAMIIELVDRSWLRTTASGRYEMHELVRQHAANKLLSEHLEVSHEPPEAVRDRHSAYYGRFAREQMGGHTDAGMGNVAPELDNIWAAWHWAAAHAKMELLEDFLTVLHRISLAFLTLHKVEEACGTAVTLLEQHVRQRGNDVGADSHFQIILSDIVSLQAEVLCLLGHQDKARTLGERSLALLPESDDDARHELMVATVKSRLSYIYRSEGDYRRAEQLAKAVLPFYQQLSPSVICNTFHYLGVCARFQGRFLEAERYSEAQRAASDPTDPYTEDVYLEEMSNTLRDKGDYVRAEALRRELHRRIRALSPSDLPQTDLKNIANTLGSGDLMVALGNFAEARAYFDAGLRVGHASGYRFVQIRALNGLGAVALATGEYEAARKHFDSARVACEDAHRKREQAVALNGLGEALLKLGEYDRARERLLAALQIAHAIQAVPVALDSLVGLAHLLIQLGSHEEAVEMLALVIHHTGATRLTREKAEQRLAVISSSLTPQVITTASARGKTTGLDETTAKLLAGERVLP